MTYTEYKKIYVKIDKKLFLTMKFLGIVDSDTRKHGKEFFICSLAVCA